MNRTSTLKLVLAAATAVTAVAYAVSPLDMIPDVVPLVGWLDDLAVLLGAALGGTWLVGSALLGLERRGAALDRREDRPAYEPIPAEIVRDL